VDLPATAAEQQREADRTVNVQADSAPTYPAETRDETAAIDDAGDNS